MHACHHTHIAIGARDRKGYSIVLVTQMTRADVLDSDIQAQYRSVLGDRDPTSALASRPTAREGTQRLYEPTPVSGVRYESVQNHHQGSRQVQ
jgi:hypothetical protein